MIFHGRRDDGRGGKEGDEDMETAVMGGVGEGEMNEVCIGEGGLDFGRRG